MLQPATGLYIWASLGIFCTLACLPECVSFPLEEVCKFVDNSARCSSITYGAIGLEKSYPCFALYYRAGCLKNLSDSDNVCCCSELFSFRSSLYDSSSKQQCSTRGKPDIYVGWSSDDFMSQFPDIYACFLNIRWFDHAAFPLSVNNTGLIVLSPGREHLLYKRGAGISSLNIEIEKTSSSELSFSCLSISPKKLDWGQNYIYHPSVSFLRLKNFCNENVIEVFEPFSTDSQFYPFNFSEVVLGPGEFTSIPFVFLPKWLGSYSAELVLQTSVGGFLVQAKGSVIESSHKLVPLLGFNVSSGGWPNWTSSVRNPLDEVIHLKEISAEFSATGNDNTLLAQVICFKQNSDFPGYSFSDAKKCSNDVIELSDSVVFAIGRLKLLDGERETITVPVEALMRNPATWKEIAPPLSAFIDAVGSCAESEITISVSVRNNASDVLKIVQITEVAKSKKLLKIKYVEGLLLFPGSVTQVALVTYDTSDVNSESFVSMAHQSLSCKLVILANDSRSSSLEVSCQSLFGACLNRQPELWDHLHLSTTERPSTFTKVMGDTEMDEFVLQKWRDQMTVNDVYLLDDDELFFPLVPLDRYSGKSITVKNPSQHPVTVQLILKSGETVDNCKPHISHTPLPWLNNFGHHDSSGPTRYGFSMVEDTVTEAFLHPYGTASLGPIFFHPSNRCEWRSLALIRSNLSGVERLSLRGYGGLFSLVLLQGPELKHKLHFNINLPNPMNVSSPVEPLLKNLILLNAGDFDVKIERIDVSGTSCGLDGFLVHNCKGFALCPGEAYEFDISYKTDFSTLVVHRDLEFKFASGMLVVPLQASMPTDILNFCRKSIFRVQVRICVIAIVLAVVLTVLLFWFITPQVMPSGSPVAYLITCEKKSIPVVRPKEKTSTRLKLAQRDKRDLKKAIIVEYVDCKTASSSDASTETSLSASSMPKSIEIESGGKDTPPVSLTIRTRKDKRRRPRKRSGAASGLIAHIEVSTSQSGNSTPSSPLSPITTFSPKNTCSLFPRESCSHESSSYPSTQSVAPVKISGSCTDNLLHSQQPICRHSTGSKPMLSSSATFPGTERPCPSRMSISPQVRAPGPKMKPPKAVELEKRTDPEGRFTYDIWGNHFPGLHLIGRSDESLGMVSEFTKGHSGSFFLRDPREALLANSAPAPVTVTRSTEKG